MEFLFEILLRVLGELILQLIFEVLLELVLHAIAEPFRRKPSPWLASVGYAMVGAAAGALSLLVAPSQLIASSFGQLLNLGLTPVLAGGAMTAIGAWRRGRDQELVRIDRFAYGYLFALSMALVRFRFGG